MGSDNYAAREVHDVCDHALLQNITVTALDIP